MEKRGFCAVAVAVLLTTGCGKEIGELKEAKEVNLVKEVDLMADITAGDVSGEVSGFRDDEEGAIALTDFGVRLLKNSVRKGENTLVSPAAVLYALGMVANGAEGETLSQVEEAAGLSREEMNGYLYVYKEALQEQGNSRCKVNLANSIWLRADDRLSVERDFLQVNADYYWADVYQVPFDRMGVERMNGWVSEKTYGMIKEFLSDVPEDAVMYLISTTALDARWSEVYYTSSQGNFTKEDGTVQQAEFMYGGEFHYLKDDTAQGFLKYYEGNQYAFAALLPDEGISVSDYVSSLTGEKLHGKLVDSVHAQVHTVLPKFEIRYEAEMSDILGEMGIKDLFDAERADLSGMGSVEEGTLVVDRILHKTFISVDEQGTKAGAAAVDEACAVAEEPDEEIEIKVVRLDRPFLYMIIDQKTKTPVFIGTVMEMPSDVQ